MRIIMKNYQFLLGLCIIVLLCASVTNAAKDTKIPMATVNVTGAAFIIDENIDIAYQRATKVALQNAVERVTNQMLEPGQRKLLKELLEKHIYKHPNDFIESSKRIDKQESDTYVNVTLKVEIPPKKVMGQLEKVKKLAAEMRKAPVGLLIHETRLEKEVTSSAAKAAIAEVLTASNFRIKEASISKSENKSLALSPTPDGIKSLGKKLGVEVLIVGRATATKLSFETFAEFFPECRAELELKAYDARNGELFIDLNEEAQDVSKGGSLKDAAKAACRKVGKIATPKFVRELYLKWLNATVARTSIQVVFDDVRYAEWQTFKELLNKSSVDLGVFHWKPYNAENKTALAEVDFRDDINVLAERLSSENFEDKLNIELIGIEDNQINLTIQKRIKEAKAPFDMSRIEDRWALLIGVGKYNSQIPSLKYTVRDVEALEAALQASSLGHFNNIKLLTDNTPEKPTRENILKALKWLYKAKAGDTVLIYYSGHGVEKDGKNYILPASTQIEKFEATAINNETFIELIEKIKAKRVITMLDSCHSGGIRKKDLVLTKKPSHERTVEPEEYFEITDRYYEMFKKAKGRVTFASSAAGQVSYEWRQKGHGIFTYYILEGIEGPADINDDKVVTFGELAGYVANNVQTWSSNFAPSIQTPVRHGTSVTGEMAVTWK